MRTVWLITGLFCLLGVFLDAFQTIILPRRPSGRFRITRLFFLSTWTPWAALARRIRDKRVREQMYSVFGPLSLLVLLAVWAMLLVLGFALVYLSMNSPFADPMVPALGGLAAGELARFRTDLYVSGTTLFTLGLGDVLPHDLWARATVILEAGTGLGFVALVIGYVPVLYGAFSRREVSIALLDARAGSPPTAAELLLRHHFEGGEEAMITLLAEWERWAAEILESHISYPILCYYRSQHDNQSWLSALTAILDACALLITNIRGKPSRQAQLTFAMARHALIDLGHVFHQEQRAKNWASRVGSDRLPTAEFLRLCDLLGDIGVRLCGDPASEARLRTIRGLYEPHAGALAEFLGMGLQGWMAEPRSKDQWKTIAALRAEAEAVPTALSHVSARSTAIQLERLDDFGHDH